MRRRLRAGTCRGRSSDGGCSRPRGTEDFGHADADNVGPGGATPGQDNTPEAMAALKAKVKVAPTNR